MSFAFVNQELCYVLCGKAKSRLCHFFIFIEEIVMEVSTTKQLICEDNYERNFFKYDIYLYEYSLQTKFHVIGLSEVWNVSLPHMLGLRGYALEVKCREAHQRGGGVGAYIHSSVPYKVLSPSLEVNRAESLWIEASFEKQTFLIGIRCIRISRKFTWYT